MSHQCAGSHIGSAADRGSRDRLSGPLETLELRWFAHGRIPDAAIEWFEEAVPGVEIEERVDSYLLTGRSDLGVKRRDNGPLEVKERLRVGGRMTVGEHLEARVEEWRKNTSGRMLAEADRWMRVAKQVRTYRVTGPAGRIAGCDIELAAVETEGTEAWTLAFEASGPNPKRIATLTAAIDRLLSMADVPPNLAAALELEAGYPAWLVTITGS